MDRRKSFFKIYTTQMNDQEPIASTSKTQHPPPKVVRKLIFHTPKKKNKTTKANTNEVKQKIKQCESVVEEKDTGPTRDNIQIYDLTADEGNNVYQNDITDKEEDTTIQKELEIFREIARQHEIEEACKQIRRENSNQCINNFELNESDVVLEYSVCQPSVDILTENKDERSELSKIEMRLECLEDFKDTDFDLAEDVDSKTTKFLNVATNTMTNQLKNVDIRTGTKRYQTETDGKNNITNTFKKTRTEVCNEVFNSIPTIESKTPNKNVTIFTNEKKLIDNVNNDLHKIEHKEIDIKPICEISNNNVTQSTGSEKKSTELIRISPESYTNNTNVKVKPKLDQQHDDGIIIENSGYEESEDQIPESNDYVTGKFLRQQKRQKYVDFMSDNEDFVWSSSSWDGSSEPSESGVDNKRNKKKNTARDKNLPKLKSRKDNKTDKNVEEDCNKSIRKKKRVNIRKETRKKKEAGQEYTTKKGRIIPAKSVKPNPCNIKNCTNKCYEVTEERRLTLFSHFWSLDTIRRKDWLVSHSKKQDVKRHRSSDTSRRTNTFNYFINDGEGQRQVCQQFLTSTLDMKQKTMYNVIVNSCHGSASEDKRGKHVPSNKTPDVVIESVRKYIQELPTLPSHYCRKNSKRTYLPQEFRNVSNLYRIYKENQEKHRLQYVGEKVFKTVFTNEFNIGFHFPRKDKCLKCTQFENDSNTNEEEKQKHLKDKEETTERFKAHQEIYNKDNSILCTSFDLQKVLNTPHGENMMLYYSRKLAVYNLTFYESGTRNGFCYTWSEVEGKRGANEVSSIIEKYVNEVDQRGTIKHLLLYCDSCPGQNKNKTVLTCLNETLRKCINLISIQINYLLPGHTYMPVDAIHSVIEKSLSGVLIWAPSQWSTVFTLARKSPKPYEVEVLTHNDFRKWDTVSDKYFKGNLVGKISKLRIVTFKKTTPDLVLVKFSMSPDAEPEEIEVSKNKNAVQLKSCYKSTLPISKKKYTDLMKLCTNKVIPTIYHEEYKRLNYSNNIQDCLVDTDIEDEENMD